MSMGLSRLKATAHGDPIETVTIDVRFQVTPAEAQILDDMPGNIAVVVRAIVKQWAKPLVQP